MFKIVALVLLPGLMLFVWPTPRLTDGAITPPPMGVLSTSEKIAPKKAVNAGPPARLKIPRINVDSPIHPVGIASNGDMEAPTEQQNVGWYKNSPYPGDTGKAVLAGHYGQKDGKGSVFDNLHTLQKGDVIYVEDEKGTTTAFIVRESRIYNHQDDAQAVFIPTDGSAHLNLITCQGAWNVATQTYLKRLVLFADKTEL